jgi:hypothetical protein
VGVTTLTQFIAEHSCARLTPVRRVWSKLWHLPAS